MFENIRIQSHTGPYEVAFKSDLSFLNALVASPENYFIIDRNILKLYPNSFSRLNPNQYLPYDATEENKDLDRVSGLIQALTDKGLKRNHRLIAIGGGITQDVTCFIASILYRGVDWEFVPTTLLAQADSCIGSKSSINCSGIKNLVGNFYPPKKIHLAPEFLKTLSPADVKSGIAEIVKVFMVKGLKEAREIAASIESFTDLEKIKPFLHRGLLYKKEIIEIDEFDRGVRNIMNYGHTFGHAIEKATEYRIPHGIAVAIGMQMANLYSAEAGHAGSDAHHALRSALEWVYSSYRTEKISLHDFNQAIRKDKKNSSTQIVLILPTGTDYKLKKTPVEPSSLKVFSENFFKTNFSRY